MSFPSQTGDLKVLVVAGDTLARAGLAAMLERESGCEVVGQVPDGPDVSSDIDTYRPDAVVWDLGWNPDSAADSLGDASEAGIPIVALVSHEDQVADAWNAGARGVLLRDADGATLLLALSAVSKGLAVLPSQAGAVAVPSPEAAPEPVALTPRELAVLKLLAEGLPNKTIAQQLTISEHTVKFHVNSILGKLGARSRTEAVTRATRLGLILL